LKSLASIGLAALLVALLASCLLSACTAPEVAMAVLGPPVQSQAVQRELRRPVYKPWEEFTMEYNTKSPEKVDWAEKLALLPKYDSGDINWVKAFKDGLIKPRPGLKDNAEDQDTEDAVVELIPKDFPDNKATYPHLPHTQILSCDNCHTSIFKMKAGADPITMKNIKAGEFCGRCHGKVAFDANACDLCHLEDG